MSLLHAASFRRPGICHIHPFTPNFETSPCMSNALDRVKHQHGQASLHAATCRAQQAPTEVLTHTKPAFGEDSLGSTTAS